VARGLDDDGRILCEGIAFTIPMSYNPHKREVAKQSQCPPR
jgi:hypothetical protein